MNKKIEALYEEIKNNPEYQNEYQKDPGQFLEKHGINIDDLPKEYLDKIAGGFFGGADVNTDIDSDVQVGDRNTLSNRGDNNRNTIMTGDMNRK